MVLDQGDVPNLLALNILLRESPKLIIGTMHRPHFYNTLSVATYLLCAGITYPQPLLHLLSAPQGNT